MKKYIPHYCEVKDIDEKGRVLFYANAFNNVDSDGDMSMPGSFTKTIQEGRKRLRHLKWHDTRYMIGAIKDIREDKEGLIVDSQLMLGTQLGKETYEEYKALAEVGQKMEHSVAVVPVKYEIDHDAEIRQVTEWKLWEVSTVTWGANPEALTVDVKNLKKYTRQDIENDIRMLRAMMNIESYDNLKLEQLEKQINYLNELKAAHQSELRATTDKDTLDRVKQILNIE